MLPVRMVNTTIRYLDGGGNSVDLVTPSTHHRNETLTGLADPMVMGVVTNAWGKLRLTGRLGLSIPLGRTEHNPFDNPDEAHQHIQMGTGTVNPIAALEAAYSWDRWRVAGFGFTQQIFYANGKGYQGGDRYAAGVALRRALGTKWSVRGGMEIQAETFETWDGMRYIEEGNQGRFDAMFAAGASWSATKELTVDLALKIPFINHVVGGQLDVPALLEVGVAYTFGAKALPPVEEEEEEEEDHEHGPGDGHDHGHADEGHAHEDEPEAHAHAEEQHAEQHGEEQPVAEQPVAEQPVAEQPVAEQPVDTKQPVVVKQPVAKPDIKDLGKDGARVDLVPVKGKITIFDFWAPWCEPCKTLEPVLEKLAKKYPTKVALRRIDVVDWDSPVVAQYLTPKAFDLPHVKIYDAKGTLVLEDSSGPGKLQSLITNIRTVVEGAQPKTPAPALSSRVSVVVTGAGFEPGVVDVPRGTPVTLRFHRKVEKTCATEIIFEHDGKRVEKKLPLDQPVELTVTFEKAGKIDYGCAMDKMISGTINVR